MTIDDANSVTQIPLERPASVRKYLQDMSSDSWLLPAFVVGSENEQLRFLFAESTLADLATYSPIVLYGDSLVGKTSLAITLAVTWSRSTGARPLCLTTGASFSEKFSAAVEIDDTDSFRARHRGCKLLLVDDFDSLASAPAAQAELAHTLDELAAARRPAIITSTRLPSATTKLSPALSSRLSGGFSLKLSRPAGPASQAILKLLCAAIAPKLDIESLVAIANRFESANLSARDLHTLVQLASESVRTQGSLNANTVAELARSAFLTDGPTVNSIAKAVARKMNVRLADMRGTTRNASIVRARGLAAHLARGLTPTSLQQIGKFFGGRDHSTILHACRKTDALLATDTELATLHRELLADLYLP